MTNILAAETADNYKLTWREWRKLWRFTRTINVPSADLVLMTPYGFVRLLWYQTSKEFRAWPNTLDSGIVVGWRWPFQKRFKEKAWIRRDDLPIALYGAMDEAYTVRAIVAMGWPEPKTKAEIAETKKQMTYIAAAIRELNKLDPQHGHNAWMSNCPMCANRALTLAARLMSEVKPKSVPDPHENPLLAFQRRQREAEKLLNTQQHKSVPELPEGN